MSDVRPPDSRHISLLINRPAADVYRYAADPKNLPDWAAGLAVGQLTRQGDGWAVESPMGRIVVEFTPPNDLGVLDHVVSLPSGEEVFNPFRVIPAGSDWAEVVFTLRPRPQMSDAEVDADAAAIATDLGALKQILESRPPSA